MWILGILLAIVAYCAARRLKKPTTSSALLALGALVFSPIVFLYAASRYISFRKSQPNESTSPAGILLAVYVIGAFLIFGYGANFAQVDAVKQTLNSILEGSTATRGVTANYVSIPKLAGVPLLGPNEYDGYFSAYGLKGDQCALATFAFKVQTVSADGSWVVSIPGVSMTQIQACTK